MLSRLPQYISCVQVSGESVPAYRPWNNAPTVLAEPQPGCTSARPRARLALRGFAETAHYDKAIHDYLKNQAVGITATANGHGLVLISPEII